LIDCKLFLAILKKNFMNTATKENTNPINSTSFPPEDAKTRVSQFMQSIQDEICQGLEALDGKGKFKEESWQREEGAEVDLV